MTHQNKFQFSFKSGLYIKYNKLDIMVSWSENVHFMDRGIFVSFKSHTYINIPFVYPGKL